MIKILLIVLLFLSSTCNATLYHVDVSTGNDTTGNGLAKDWLNYPPNGPWKTINKGTDALSAGDTLHVRQGDYGAEHVDIDQNDGSAGNEINVIGDKYGIIWEGDGVGNVELNPDSNYSVNSNFKIRKSHWKFRGFYFTDWGAVEIAASARLYAGAGYIYWEDMEYNGKGTLTGGISTTFTDTAIDYVFHKNILMYNCKNINNYLTSVNAASSDYWTIEGYRVFNSTSTYGIIFFRNGLDPTNFVVKNCYFYNCDDNIIAARYAIRIYIYNNTFKNCKQSMVRTNWNGSDFNTVYNNKCETYTTFCNSCETNDIVDYNQYSTVSGAEPSVGFTAKNGTNYVPWATYQANSGWDANGVNLGIKFNDTSVDVGKETDTTFANRGFTIQATDTGIDSGLVIAGVTEDILGRDRPAGSNDIGCYQYGVGNVWGKIYNYYLKWVPMIDEEVRFLSALAFADKPPNTNPKPKVLRTEPSEELLGLDWSNINLEGLEGRPTYWAYISLTTTDCVDGPIGLMEIMRNQSDFKEYHKWDRNTNNKMGNVYESKDMNIFVETYRDGKVDKKFSGEYIYESSATLRLEVYDRLTLVNTEIP